MFASTNASSSGDGATTTTPGAAARWAIADEQTPIHPSANAKTLAKVFVIARFSSPAGTVPPGVLDNLVHSAVVRLDWRIACLVYANNAQRRAHHAAP